MRVPGAVKQSSVSAMPFGCICFVTVGKYKKMAWYSMAVRKAGLKVYCVMTKESCISYWGLENKLLLTYPSADRLLLMKCWWAESWCCCKANDIGVHHNKVCAYCGNKMSLRWGFLNSMVVISNFQIFSVLWKRALCFKCVRQHTSINPTAISIH